MLIVAHRLATIIDSDRILVMSDGEAREFNHPFSLMVRSTTDESITAHRGYFSQMVLETGAETAFSLFEIAKDSFKKSNEKWPTAPAAADDDKFFNINEETNGNNSIDCSMDDDIHEEASDAKQRTIYSNKQNRI